MAIFISFGLFKNFRKKELVRKGHEGPTRVVGAPYPSRRGPLPREHLVCLLDSVSCTICILVGKKSLYNLPKVLTPVSRKSPLFLFRAIFLTDLGYHDGPKRLQGQVLREGHQPLPRGGAATPSNH